MHFINLQIPECLRPDWATCLTAAIFLALKLKSSSSILFFCANWAQGAFNFNALKEF